MPVKEVAVLSLPLQTQVYQRILEGIITFRLAPGTRLVENRLALQLGVSRLPVREALRQLEREQLVVVTPRRGASVASLTPRDADEIYTLRIALEALAARLAAENAGGKEIRAMDATLGEAAVLGMDDYLRFYTLGAQFHAQIVVASGNQKLVAMHQVISHHVARLRTIQAQSSRPEIMEETQRKHLVIFHAIARRQPRRAEQLLEDHISRARDRIVPLLRTVSADGLGAVNLLEPFDVAVDG